MKPSPFVWTIRIKLFLSHFLATFLVLVGIGAYFYLSAVSSLIRNLQTRLQNSAALVSEVIDAKNLADIQNPSDVVLPAYLDNLSLLRQLKRTNSDIAYLYIMRRIGDRVFFVIDSDDTEAQALPGREYLDSPVTLLEGFSRPAVDNRVYQDEWGTFMSGYSPIRNGEGTYLIGIDMRANEVENKLAQVQLSAAISLGGVILLALLISQVLSNQFTRPIRLLIDRCRAIANGRLNDPVELHTGDEQDALIQAFNTMSARLGESIEQNRMAAEDLRKARDELEIRVLERTKDLTELNDKLLHEISERKRVEEALALAASADSLTGLLNRRAMQEHLEYQIIRYQRSGEPFTVLMGDLDHFKQINDTCGHDVGDQVLIEAATRLQYAIRGQDRVARWGGEEFLILLPDTDLDGGLVVAEKVNQAISGAPFVVGVREMKLTLSVGVTAYTPGQTLDDCIRAADVALYKAKHLGRDRVVGAE